jgi:hypothetical protein
MNKKCSDCFYTSTLAWEEPCLGCLSKSSGARDMWVAIDFLKNVPDDTMEEDEAFEVMAGVASQLMKEKAPEAVEETWKSCENCHHSLAIASLGPCGGCENVCIGKATKWEKIEAPKALSALDKQVSGGHYKDLKIQPIEFIHANNIPFAEGCAIKYLCRWRDKGGIKDLEKAKHFIELLIELEGKK